MWDHVIIGSDIFMMFIYKCCSPLYYLDTWFKFQWYCKTITNNSALLLRSLKYHAIPTTLCFTTPFWLSSKPQPSFPELYPQCFWETTSSKPNLIGNNWWHFLIYYRIKYDNVIKRKYFNRNNDIQTMTMVYIVYLYVF